MGRIFSKYQHHVSAWLSEHSSSPENMFNGIPEEDHLWGLGVTRILLHVDLLEDSLDADKVPHRFVDTA